MFIHALNLIGALHISEAHRHKSHINNSRKSYVLHLGEPNTSLCIPAPRVAGKACLKSEPSVILLGIREVKRAGTLGLGEKASRILYPL